MKHLGISVPPLMKEPSRAFSVIASAIWIVASLPFFYLAYLYWNWPHSVFIEWRGWVFGSVAFVCILMATIVPPRYRVAIVGTRLRGWGRMV